MKRTKHEHFWSSENNLPQKEIDSKIQIEDDFLPQKEFDKIHKMMIDGTPSFPWYYTNHIDLESDVDKFQFIHLFYLSFQSQSPFVVNLNPIFEKLKSISVYRIKANLLTRTSEIVQNRFHVDLEILPEEKQKHWTTSIFYMNTNNGYTKFEDGTKVESKANRMISFPSNMKHTGTSCTDERIRVVINFNYYR